MDFKATYRFTNMPLGIHIEEKGRFIANGHDTLYKLMTARCSSRKTYLHVYIQIRQGQFWFTDRSWLKHKNLEAFYITSFNSYSSLLGITGK